MGIGSFGPLCLDPAAPNYGSITSTPKPGWGNYPLLQALTEGRNLPAAMDTDVNAAVLAEIAMGAAKGCDNAVYITVGTGIGGGVAIHGKAVHGLVHPEVGHMLLSIHPDDPLKRGVCPYHTCCAEGLAAGPALGKRAGQDARNLPDDHPVFQLEAYYLAQLCVNLIMTLSPERIILGGGVLARDGLLPMVRKQTLELLGGYVQHPAIQSGLESLIVKPALFPISGLAGAYLLGKEALEGRK